MQPVDFDIGVVERRDLGRQRERITMGCYLLKVHTIGGIIIIEIVVVVVIITIHMMMYCYRLQRKPYATVHFGSSERKSVSTK